MPADPVPHPWRRFLRFSVRGLIVLVLVIGAGLGWIVREAHIQRDAVAAIKKAGGSVKYDWEWSEWEVDSGRETRAPRWLVDLIGVDYFGHVTAVWFSHVPRGNRCNARRRRASHPTRQLLYANSHASVSDTGLAHLKGLTKLTFSTSAALGSPTPGWRI